MRRRILVPTLLSATLAFATATGPALAADPPPQDVAQARELGQQAQATYEAGNFAESEKLWAAAERLYPAAPTLTLGLARAQAKLGKLVLAQEAYNKILREHGQAKGLSPAFKDALEAARAEVGAVSAKIANVVISVEGPANPQVTLDGQPVSSAGLGLKRPIDPGSHTVRAEAPGYEPAETAFEVAPSGSAEAKLKLEKRPDAPAPEAAPGGGAHAYGPEASTPSRGSNKTLAIIAFGVGGAGLVFGGVTGAIALGQHGDLSSKCPDGRCASELGGDVDAYQTMGTLSTIGFVVGGVGVAAGAVLWFTAPKEAAHAATSTKAAETTLLWQPYVGVGGGGVTGRF